MKSYKDNSIKHVHVVLRGIDEQEVRRCLDTVRNVLQGANLSFSGPISLPVNAKKIYVRTAHKIYSKFGGTFAQQDYKKIIQVQPVANIMSKLASIKMPVLPSGVTIALHVIEKDAN